ncbi:protein SICKLE isoform X1 [Ziziphus jujuba]|uniref:Protein SICKLE isoform X1 n=1 Tax=Ziziphus jujuba TaxID=326968 RepID=A0A6P3ZS51_ZIZJJ|nr:protein SICKLE isoform X1 [Ziziphus jujuba]XP_015876357.3 protein SICKLE isoform X1 [Ziziphus jujuba]
MEESEKRRERLKAMRMEAACSENSNDLASPMPSLSNPLADTSKAMHDGYCATSRFGFYTDPMAAFSADKKRNNAGNNQISADYSTSPIAGGSSKMGFSSPLPAGPRNPGMTSPGAYQFQSNYTPNQMYQARGFGLNSSFPRSPMGIHRPTMHQGNPDAWNGSGGAAGYNFSPNPSRECNFPSPRFGPTGSPCFNTGQGRANWPNQSPSPGFGLGASSSPSSGRGGDHWRSGRSPASGQRGGWGNFSPGSGRRGGRRLGSHARPSAVDRPLGPEKYYDNAMVEDPWEFLEPVIWKGVDDPLNSLRTPESSRSSISGTKRAKTYEVPGRSNNQPSLAEYLAASLNEADNDSSSI